MTPSSRERLSRRLEARARVQRSLRADFERVGSLEVETPTLGVCPGLDANVHALGGVDVGGERRFLMTSPEFFMKRLLASGLPRVHQFARVFRAEELGPWHEPEFTLLEWYETGGDLERLVGRTEEVVRAAASALCGNLGAVPLRIGGAAHVIDLGQPFTRMTVREAFRTFAGIADAVDLALTDEQAYFQHWVDSVEPGLARTAAPVFITHFPASQAALAELDPSDPSVAMRVELTLGGVELSNGYVELTDVREQRRRFEAELEKRRVLGQPTYPLDEDFLGALESGMPRAVGMALGFDRLLALLVQAESIQEVMAFPRRLT